MLILTRKCNESIRIGDDVTITIMRIEPGQVRVGIDAPRGVPVHREEVYERIQAEQDAIVPPTGEALNKLAQNMKRARRRERGQVSRGDQASRKSREEK